MRIAVRTRSHGVLKLEVEEGCTLDALAAKVAAQTGLQPWNVQLLSGFPPKPLLGQGTLAGLGVRSGEQFTLKRVEGTPPPQPEPEASAKGEQAAGQEDDKEGEEGEEGEEVDPVIEPEMMDADIFMLRRVVNADNHCLFNCIGYCLEGRTRLRFQDMRQLVADAIKADPSNYTAVFLGQPPASYRKWIMEPTAWGGGIEVDIFSKAYRCEICCLDIQTNRMDTYGYGKKYKQRIYLLYDGIHYDPMVANLVGGDNAPEDLDITIFSPRDAAVEQKAQSLCNIYHDKRAFTDTSKFQLKCLVCQQGLEGEKDAIAHASATGHTNFSEFQ